MSVNQVSLEILPKPARDIVLTAGKLGDKEIRFIVDSYYQQQENRKASANQIRSIDQGADEGVREGHALLDWQLQCNATMEKGFAAALKAYANDHIMGAWLDGVHGIGPILAAGLLAHLSVNPWKCRNPKLGTGTKEKRVFACSEKAPCTPECGRVIIETVGHWWRFAGLDPTLKWEKGKKRPFNAGLKTLCWKVGDSFCKQSGSEDCFYGKVYLQRKVYENERNDRGANAVLAAERLPMVGKTTEAFKHFTLGKLPPGQIDARSRRYAVKFFLSHMHNEWYRLHFRREPPLPYPISVLGHAHLVQDPQGGQPVSPRPPEAAANT